MVVDRYKFYKVIFDTISENTGNAFNDEFLADKIMDELKNNFEFKDVKCDKCRMEYYWKELNDSKCPNCKAEIE